MKESIWLQNYLKAEKEKRDLWKGKWNREFKPCITILGIGCILTILYDLFLPVPNTSVELMTLAFIIIIPIAICFVILMCLLVMRLFHPRDFIKTTENEITALFKTDSDVEQFDREMSSEPVKEIDVGPRGVIFMTEHYFGIRKKEERYIKYNIICKKDIASMQAKNMKSSGYFLFIRNSEQKMLICITGLLNTTTDKLMDMLKAENPEIRLE